MSLFKPPARRPQEILVRQIRFLGEQDGPPERLLKDKLKEIFVCDRKVTNAYLARVDFGDRQPVSVVLALRMQPSHDRVIAEKVASVFASIFSAAVHLDIMYLTEREEAELSRVCNPFFH
jgi:SseB protein C-terminal domain